MKTKLKLAIQKSGKLSIDSIKILERIGIELNNGANPLKITSTNFPVEIFFLRDDDIPYYVKKGFFDIGIVGKNVVIENNEDVEITNHLGFGKCRLSIAIPNNQDYNSINDLGNQCIATSYPYILTQYLMKNKISSEIHKMTGSVEIAPSIGLANIICDLVSTGATLRANELKEVETILESEAVLIKNKFLQENKQLILDELLSKLNVFKKSKMVLSS